jgi:hypothetical protein
MPFCLMHALFGLFTLGFTWARNTLLVPVSLVPFLRYFYSNVFRIVLALYVFLFFKMLQS